MKISVVMTTYNGEKYLKTQIESILNQVLLPDEIIICDDKSTDNTFKILKDYQNIEKPKFIISQNILNIGYIRNFEQALKKCTGEVVFLCDQDDFWHSDKIEKMITFDSEYSLVHTDAVLIDADGKKIAESYSDYKKKTPEISNFP